MTADALEIAYVTALEDLAEEVEQMNRPTRAIKERIAQYHEARDAFAALLEDE